MHERPGVTMPRQRPDAEYEHGNGDGLECRRGRGRGHGYGHGTGSRDLTPVMLPWLSRGSDGDTGNIP
jgi:hypothetical protein